MIQLGGRSRTKKSDSESDSQCSQKTDSDSTQKPPTPFESATLVAGIGYGVDRRLLLIVKSLYSCSKLCVRSGRNTSRPFTVCIGHRQGCVLSPLIFSLHQGLPNYGPWATSSPPTSLIRPAKVLAQYFQVPRF